MLSLRRGTCPAFVTCAGASFSALPSPEGCHPSSQVLLRRLQRPPKVPGYLCRSQKPPGRWQQLGPHYEKVTLDGDAVGCSEAAEMHCDMWYQVNLGSTSAHVVTVDYYMVDKTSGCRGEITYSGEQMDSKTFLLLEKVMATTCLYKRMIVLFWCQYSGWYSASCHNSLVVSTTNCQLVLPGGEPHGLKAELQPRIHDSPL